MTDLAPLTGTDAPTVPVPLDVLLLELAIERNLARRRAYQRAYRAAHLEHCRAYNREYYHRRKRAA